MWFDLIISAFIIGIIIGTLSYKQEPIRKLSRIINVAEAIAALFILLALATIGDLAKMIYGTGLDLILAFMAGILLSASIGESPLI